MKRSGNTFSFSYSVLSQYSVIINIKNGCLHSSRVNLHDNVLWGGWRKWKKSSPHVPRTVSKQNSPSPHNVCSPSRRWLSLFPVHCGRSSQTRTLAFKEVPKRVDNDPSTSTRAIAHAMGSNQNSMLRVLQEQNLHAYHLHKVQGLALNDFAPRVRIIVNPAFPAQVLFTHEACFTRDGYFNSRNSYIGTMRIRTQCSSEFTRRDST